MGWSYICRYELDKRLDVEQAESATTDLNVATVESSVRESRQQHGPANAEVSYK